MNPAKLRWADGRENRAEIDPTTTSVSFVGLDDRYHTFKETEEIDEDGCDIYEEELEST